MSILNLVSPSHELGLKVEEKLTLMVVSVNKRLGCCLMAFAKPSGPLAFKTSLHPCGGF